MNDSECVDFLRWALPRMGFRWPGFRKVRRQVCRRIRRRMAAVGAASAEEYRAFLEEHPGEWRRLDHCCRVTISRFYRDRRTWRRLGEEVLPALAARVGERGGRRLRAWSAGCASGEEPYTLRLVWELEVAERFPGIHLELLASDADPHMLARAARGSYPPGSLRELPGWRDRAFERRGDHFRLRPPFRAGVGWLRHDLRQPPPTGPFHLLLCRNLAFTYFDEALQRTVLERLLPALHPGGVLVLGSHETPPEDTPGLVPWPGGGEQDSLYLRTDAATDPSAD